jgi:hypothetical protein
MQSRKFLPVFLSWNNNNNRKGRVPLLVQNPSNPNFIITKTKWTQQCLALSEEADIS